MTKARETRDILYIEQLSRKLFDKAHKKMILEMIEAKKQKQEMCKKLVTYMYLSKVLRKVAD